MPADFARSDPASRSRKPVLRALLWLCTLVFALQMLGAGWHTHDLADQGADCVSCQIAAQLPATTPGAAPALLAVFLAVAYVLARRPRTVHIARPGYLRPSPHAPPRIS